MEFLYKLYDMEYFAVGLLIVIAILVFLFLLILFFGKKEEKQRKLEETNKLSLESATGFKEVEGVKEKLKVPEIPQPSLDVVEEKVQTAEMPTFEEPFVNEPLKVETPVVEEPLKDELPTIEPIKVEESFISDITTDLNNSEVVEDNSLENKDIEPILPEIDIDNLFQTNLGEVPQEEKIEELKEEESEVVEEPTKVEAPFSSVYINNEISNVAEVQKTEELKKTPPVFELPKMAEMPKLKEEVNVEKANDFDNLFGDIEPETYSIKK